MVKDSVLVYIVLSCNVFCATFQMQMHLLRLVKQPGEGDHRVVLEGAVILMEIPTSPLVMRMKTKLLIHNVR